MTIKINYIEEAPINIENQAVDKLITDFNKLAKEKKSKYRIKIKYNQPLLVRKIAFFQDYENQIVYNYIENNFNFCDEFSEDIFNEVKGIFEELTQEFEVNLLKDKEVKN